MADVAQQIVPMIPWEEIKLGTMLGKGGFGIVYKSTWLHSQEEVAVKKIMGTLSPDAAKELKQEAAMQAGLNSPYIVRLFGLCWDDKEYAMVMELMPNKSLFDLLHSGQELPWSLRYQIANDIAYGLRLLHSKTILHRDMKSLNVLLDTNLRAKLSDFGLAKVKAHSSSTSKQGESVGTTQWKAPELLSLSPKYSNASDIYAYGITAWELAAREIPYQGVDDKMIKNLIKEGERADIPEGCPAVFAELIKSCWSQTPTNRPTMDMVIAALSPLVKKEPPKPSTPSSTPTIPSGSISNSNSSSYKDNLDSFGLVSEVSTPQHVLPKLPLPMVNQFQATTPAQLNEYDVGLQYYNKCQFGKATEYFMKISFNTEAPYYLAACCKLWRIFKPGIGAINIDIPKAEVYGKIVASNVVWFMKQAETGSADSQSDLGYLYYYGQGVVQDYKKALFWYEKSAAQEAAASQHMIGWMYHKGFGVTQDYEKARNWYEKAISQNYAISQTGMGLLYFSGLGVEQDYKKALFWYEKSAIQEYTWAQYWIGYMYHKGLGVKQDYKQAYAWYEKSAAQGNSLAKNNIGWLYHDGLGVARNYNQALAWFEKAAAQDDQYAQHWLGVMYRDGHGVAQNYIQARIWFEKSAIQGNALAQNNLGALYFNAQGVSRDDEQARIWFEKSASQGNELAKENLEKLPQQNEQPKQKKKWSFFK